MSRGAWHASPPVKQLRMTILVSPRFGSDDVVRISLRQYLNGHRACVLWKTVVGVNFV